jgi:hypothetical protein
MVRAEKAEVPITLSISSRSASPGFCLHLALFLGTFQDWDIVSFTFFSFSFSFFRKFA